MMRTFHSLKNKKSTRQNLRKSATPQELILWSRLRANQLGYKFRRQHSIGKYIVDFYCPKKKLVIEIDGGQHQEESQERYDQKRSKFLESLDFRVLRFWNNEVNDNLEGVMERILEELKQNNTSPYPSSTEEGKLKMYKS